jgi:hypothetical protein
MKELEDKIKDSHGGATLSVGLEWPRYAIPLFFHWTYFSNYNLKLAYLLGVGIDKT